MARLNADMERQAIELLHPQRGDVVLAIGFGPGVGVEALARTTETARVLGVDPSAMMLRQAARRNRAAVASGRVELVQADAAHLPWGDATADGAVAVNSLQLWDPLVESARDVARVLRAGARLVTLTHTWAIEKKAPVEAWLEQTRSVLATAGFSTFLEDRSGRARSGATVTLEATRA
jgi:ubiquinone/menaquinone biosynthesis C-methylase UbiE